MAGLKRVVAWWGSLPLPWRRWRIVGRVAAGDDVPDWLPHRGVVLVGAPDLETWAVFDCPCRNGHRLLVNLDRTRYPFWWIDCYKPLSIRPSIDSVTPERRCHFTIRSGKTRWSHEEYGATK